MDAFLHSVIQAYIRKKEIRVPPTGLEPSLMAQLPRSTDT